MVLALLTYKPRLLEGFQHSYLIKQKVEICNQKYIGVYISLLNLMSEKNESLN